MAQNSLAPVILRPATPIDLPALTRLAYAAKSHWGYPSSWLALWEPDLTFTDATLAAQHVVVAEQDGRAVGVYALSLAGQVAELEHCWVDPACMGRGIGRRLVEAAATHARKLGAAQLRIVSDPHAEAFYRHLGARRVGDVPSTPVGRTLPLLVLDLADSDTAASEARSAQS